ncbi:MAG: AAA family ATPase [Nitrospirae bacterium]|nr:AAA family ATPase [Nitrospirota bacterium]
MRITKVNIPKDLNPNSGLGDIKMDRLGQIVLLAGKNGSGKTRILQKIRVILTRISNKTLINSLNQEITNENNQILRISDNRKQLLKDLETISSSDTKQIENIKHSIKEIEEEIGNRNNNIYNKKALMEVNLIETSDDIEKCRVIDFVPNKIEIKDCVEYSPKQRIDSAQQLEAVGIGGLSEGTFSKIQVIQDKWFNATHPQLTISEGDKNIAINNYDKLKTIINQFLNTTIDRDVDGNVTLFGFKIGQSQLSAGQKILLQFCVAIYSQETALKDQILFMDEPENHLHPSAVIEILNRISEHVTDGQIWIATHSIPLLAHYDPSQIWYVDDNSIRHAGKIPEDVLSSLLGNEDEVGNLQNFISLPAQFASINFACESLLEPQAIMTTATDKQSIQIRKKLLDITGKGKIRLLDFGAGKGRIISNLFDQDIEIIKQLDYIAFDTNTKDQEYCKDAISRAYGTHVNRYFNKTDEILSTYDKKTFNVIIMCNVLHEIAPKKWFNSFDIIKKLIHENGLLLIVENQLLPNVEKAYQEGFLVLDTLQLKTLFKIPENDLNFNTEESSKDDRLKIHSIPAGYLHKIDHDSKSEAIKSLYDTAIDEIIKIRKGESTYKNGNIHGFWVQQLANAALNLSELGQ